MNAPQMITVQTSASFSVDDLFGILEEGIPLARYVASLTAPPWDDKAVELLAVVIRSQPLRDWFASLLDAVSKRGGNVEELPMSAVAAPEPQALAAAAADAGVEKEEFIEYIPMILKVAQIILTMLEKRRGGGRGNRRGN